MITAQSLCCLVVAEGPDTLGAVAAGAAFHGAVAADPDTGGGASTGGRVALSTSGLSLTPFSAASGDVDLLVAAPLTLLSPFLGGSALDFGAGGRWAAAAAGPRLSSPPLLPPGVSLRVLLPAAGTGSAGGAASAVVGTSSSSSSSSSSCRWSPAEVVAVARLPAAAAALRSALTRLRGAEDPAGGGGYGGGGAPHRPPPWRLGWALATGAPARGGGGSASFSASAAEADEASTFLVLRVGGGGGGDGSGGGGGGRARATAAAATGGAATAAAGARRRAPPPCPVGDLSCYCCPSPLVPAAPVVAWGAPFGALAPWHFQGSAVAGVVSGALPPSPYWQEAAAAAAAAAAAGAGAATADAAPVLRLDVAALPGMEGGPVACGRCGRLAAVLSRPLTRSASGGAGGGAPPEGSPSGPDGGAIEVPLGFPADLLLSACRDALGSWAGRAIQAAPAAAAAAPTAAPAAAAAATAAAASAGAMTGRPCGSPCEPAPPARLAAALARGVVMVRCGGAWATGVVLPRGPGCSSGEDGSGGGHVGSAGRRRAGPPAPRAISSSSSGSPAEPAPVLVLTIAHLFDHAGGGGAASAGTMVPPSALPPPPPAAVRVTCPQTGRRAWAPALPLHLFRSPQLDLAVLAVPYPSPDSDAPVSRNEASAPPPGDPATLLLRRGLDALAPLQLLLPAPGVQAVVPASHAPAPIVVAGHGLFGPALGWPAAATAGSVARLVRLRRPPSSDAGGGAALAPLPSAFNSNGTVAPRPSPAPPPPPPAAAAAAALMAVTTAAVHAGASGAAVLCASTGRLAAVATSNSRHVGPARVASTLPRWNYAVPADALRPLFAWAARATEAAAAGGGGGAASFDVRGAAEALREMDRRALQEGGEAAARVWALMAPVEMEGGQTDGGLRARL